MLSRIEKPEGSYLVQTEYVKSPRLAGHRAGENPCRPLTVLLPPEAAEARRGQRFPVLYALASWLGAGRQMTQWEPFRESLPERLFRLTKAGAMRPCVVVCPDLYTSFGGSQYINSSFFGPHADHIVEELIPYIEAHYPVLPGPQSRAVFGRSSGGFGALRLALDFPGTFAAVACHAGDMGFDLLYRRDLVDICYALARYSGQVGPFLEALRRQPKLSGKDTHVLMLLGMAGSYSPDLSHPDGFRLPIDPLTGKINEEVWQQWLANDPLHCVQRDASGLKQLRQLFLDCGNKDQYHLQFGLRQMKELLVARQIPAQIMEFDDNHSGTAYRFDLSLPLLSEALEHER